MRTESETETGTVRGIGTGIETMEVVVMTGTVAKSGQDRRAGNGDAAAQLGALVREQEAEVHEKVEIAVAATANESGRHVVRNPI